MIAFKDGKNEGKKEILCVATELWIIITFKKVT